MLRYRILGWKKCCDLARTDEEVEKKAPYVSRRKEPIATFSCTLRYKFRSVHHSTVMASVVCVLREAESKVPLPQYCVVMRT